VICERNRVTDQPDDDLQARSVELQELAVSLESERRTSESERARLSPSLSA
jgi:hypothetical protein